MDLSNALGFWCRPGTVDANAVFALRDDEYGLWDHQWTGWAVDVGAQIGTVGISLALHNADLRVVCIEAVPESSDILERNIAAFGLEDRVVSVRAWAGAPGALSGTCHYGYRGGDVESDGYVAAHRFVGNTWVDSRSPEFSAELPAVSLDGILAAYGISDVAIMKIDCEGCEWDFLDTPAVAKVHTITGEYHGGYPGKIRHQPVPWARLHALLDATHTVTVDETSPIVGDFRAVRR
jgi:FkbM family methyltransferase